MQIPSRPTATAAYGERMRLSSPPDNDKPAGELGMSGQLHDGRHIRAGGNDGHAETQASPGAPVFHSILFPPGLEKMRQESPPQPDCFVDLNLDQIVAGIIGKRNEDVLKPIFHATYRDEKIVRYRQAVFADLDRPELFAIFPGFGEAMAEVRANLDYAGKLTPRAHRNLVLLRAVGRYCEAVQSLLGGLRSARLQSSGLQDVRNYLENYTVSHGFVELVAETADLRETFLKVSYGMLFRGDRVTVRKYAGEPDFTATIIERFAKFREADAPPPPVLKLRDEFSLNHIEQGVLEFVARLFPKEFARLEAYARRHAAFIDDVVAAFDREIAFFVAYLAYIDPLRKAGLPFCYPEVSATGKETEALSSFDLALATKLQQENGSVVCNDFRLTGAERLIVVSGPNQGGKTTFARMFGQLHFLAGLGCPVPGKKARLFLADRLFTHFEREENITNLRGKLEEELVRLHRSCESMTSDSVVILNEIFNSTSLDDQILLSTRVLNLILGTDAIGVCVTFIDALSTLSEKTVSMVSTIVPDDPSRRTFEIVRKPADGLAYALSLAEKHGVTYDRLRARIQP